MALTTTQKTEAYQFFIVAFGAATGVEYMNQLNDAYNAGMTTKQIVNVYTTKPQFETLYPRFDTNEQFAERLIENVVGASATAAAKTEAKADVAAALNAGWTKGDIVFQIFTNLAAKASTDAQWGKTSLMLANKVAVAQYITETQLVNTTDLTKLSSYIASVTEVAASVDAAKLAAQGANGQTFTLTTSVDTPALTSGNDTINGVTGDATAANNSYTLGDNISDNSTTDSDTLNLTLVGTTASPVVTVKNVETINLVNSGAGAHTFNAVSITGANTIKATVSTAGDTETITNVGSLSTAVGLAGKGNLTASHAASLLTGTADTVMVSVEGVGTSATTRSTVNVANGNAVEGVKIATTGTNYFDVNGGTAAATFTITGAGDNTIGGFTGAGSLTVDASAATGKQTYTVADLGLGDVIKGGTGTADTLSTTLTTATTSLPTVSGFETLKLGFTAAGTYNATKTTDVTTLSLTDYDGAAATVSELAAGVATVNLQETTANTSAVSLSYATGADSAVTVAVGATDTTATNVVVDMGNLTVAGNKGALTITSGGEAANSIDALTANTATSITIDALTKGLTQTGAASATAATSVTLNATAGSLSVAAGNTFTATKATTIAMNATGGALSLATIVSDANVSSASIVASGNETNDVAVTLLDVDHVSAISISADNGADVTVSDIEMLGVDSATTPADLSTSLTINAIHADSVVTISDLSPAANAVLDSLVVKGAGDVNIGTGTALDANIDITSLNAADLTGSLTFVGTSINAAMTVLLGNAGSSETNTVTTGSGNDVITGGTGKESVVGGAGDDVISLGAGADSVDGGAGSDNIDLGSDTAADKVIFSQLTGQDTIVNFVVGTDTLEVSNASVNGGEIEITAAAAQGAITNDRTYVIEQTVGTAAALTTGGTATISDFTNTTQVAAYLSERFTGDNDTVADEVALIIMNNGTNSYAYVYADSTTANTTIDAGELTLIGVFNNAVMLDGSVTQV